MYTYIFRPRAEREFKKLSRQIQTQIRDKLKFFISTPNPTDFAVHLRDFELGSYRFRIGDYRVTFDIQGDHIVILKVGHRREVYR